MKENIEKLIKYIPIVDRVHGNNHPEFHKVREVFTEIVKKIDRNEDVTADFELLKVITKNYEIPSDVCESYTEVFETLALLDQHYSQ